MKPGAFKETTDAFLSFFPRAIIVANVSWLESSPLTTSSNLMMFAGLKKWVPTTLSGLSVAADNESISRPDVLEANIASLLTIASRFLNIEVFNSRFSYTASITISTSWISLYSRPDVIRLRTKSFCSSFILPLFTINS